MQSFKSEQFTRYSINTVVSQFSIFIIAVVTSIITARLLGPEGKGQLALVLLIPMLVVTFGRMGIGHAVNYYAGKTTSTKLIANSLALSVLISVLLIIPSFLTVFSVKSIFFKEVDERFIIIICSFMPFYLFNNHFISLLQGLYRIDHINIISIARSAINLILLIVLIRIFSLGLTGAIIAAIVSVLLAVFLLAFFLFKEINLKEVGLDFNLMKQLLKFGFKSHTGNILKDLSYRSDILIISYFLPAASVGYYTVAVVIGEIIWNIPNAIGSVLLPRVARMDNKSAKLFTPAVIRTVLVPVTIACFMIFLLGKSIIIFAFGQDFLPSASALIILLPGIWALTVWKILASDLIAQGHPMKYSFTSGIALVTMVILDLWLIPELGINGAAIASTISYIAATVSIIFIYTRITGNSLKELFVPTRAEFLLYQRILRSVFGEKYV